VIHIEFIAFEIDAGEERVFCERVIGEKIFACADDLMNGAALLMLAAQ